MDEFLIQFIISIIFFFACSFIIINGAICSKGNAVDTVEIKNNNNNNRPTPRLVTPKPEPEYVKEISVVAEEKVEEDVEFDDDEDGVQQSLVVENARIVASSPINDELFADPSFHEDLIKLPEEIKEEEEEEEETVKRVESVKNPFIEKPKIEMQFTGWDLSLSITEDEQEKIARRKAKEEAKLAAAAKKKKQEKLPMISVKPRETKPPTPPSIKKKTVTPSFLPPIEATSALSVTPVSSSDKLVQPVSAANSGRSSIKSPSAVVIINELPPSTRKTSLPSAVHHNQELSLASTPSTTSTNHQPELSMDFDKWDNELSIDENDVKQVNSDEIVQTLSSSKSSIQNITPLKLSSRSSKTSNSKKSNQHSKSTTPKPSKESISQVEDTGRRSISKLSTPKPSSTVPLVRGRLSNGSITPVFSSKESEAGSIRPLSVNKIDDDHVIQLNPSKPVTPKPSSTVPSVRGRITTPVFSSKESETGSIGSNINDVTNGHSKVELMLNFDKWDQDIRITSSGQSSNNETPRSMAIEESNKLNESLKKNKSETSSRVSVNLASGDHENNGKLHLNFNEWDKEIKINTN